MCLVALREWRSRQAFADAILHRHLRALASPADRALLTALFYGVLRNLTLLDRWIAQLASRPPDATMRDLLRMGLYQTLVESFPEHAAVNETVALAAPGAAGFANAILRESLRRRSRLHAELPGLPPAVRWSHPSFLVARWTAEFGQNATAALCEWNNTPAAVTARVNALSGVSREDLLARQDVKAAASPHHPMGIVLDGSPGLLVEEGAIYPQDPSAMRIVDLLDPQPGERILDACAAPGGKATDIAARMAGGGDVFAVDSSGERLRLVEDNAHRLGAGNVRTLRHDWLQVFAPPAGFKFEKLTFDRAIVDAPCSNTGVLRRRVDARWRLSAEDFRVMPQIQLRLLEAVAPWVRPGGILVYSTCSIDPAENTGVARAFAMRHTEFAECGRADFFPPRDGFDGGFAVCWRKRQ